MKSAIGKKMTSNEQRIEAEYRKLETKIPGSKQSMTALYIPTHTGAERAQEPLRVTLDSQHRGSQSLGHPRCLTPRHFSGCSLMPVPINHTRRIPPTTSTYLQLG